MEGNRLMPFNRLCSLNCTGDLVIASATPEKCWKILSYSPDFGLVSDVVPPCLDETLGRAPGTSLATTYCNPIAYF